jgi:hypothetical protein
VVIEVVFPAFQKGKQCISLQTHLKKFQQLAPDKGQKRVGEKQNGGTEELTRFTPQLGGQSGDNDLKQYAYQIPIPNQPKVKHAGLKGQYHEIFDPLISLTSTGTPGCPDSWAKDVLNTDSKSRRN